MASCELATALRKLLCILDTTFLQLPRIVVIQPANEERARADEQRWVMGYDR